MIRVTENDCIRYPETNYLWISKTEPVTSFTELELAPCLDELMELAKKENISANYFRERYSDLDVCNIARRALRMPEIIETDSFELVESK